ncbi:MAG: thiazole synthase [Succinivibrionaceae bacterium]
MDSLKIGDKVFSSRLFTGTGKFSNSSTLVSAIEASGSQLVTLAVKRCDFKNGCDAILPSLKRLKVNLLPNTSGARTAKEAVFAANLAREALGTNFIKVEIHPEQRYLLPDPIETFNATKELVKQGFTVLPYCSADPVLCLKLADVGASAVMPLGSPIGSNQGLTTLSMLKIIIAQKQVPVVIDAGIGSPSHAAYAMELGADAVLVNTAISVARDPVSMAKAFALAVESGRTAYLAGLGVVNDTAIATSPLDEFLKELSSLEIN